MHLDADRPQRLGIGMPFDHHAGARVGTRARGVEVHREVLGGRRLDAELGRYRILGALQERLEKHIDPRVRGRYGRDDSWGQSCLLARRLVEAGVTYVTVNMGGWDTHGNNFAELKRRLLPRYDRALAALISDLHDRGMDKDVLVISYGEFGRTPRINKDSGRDHWPNAASVVFSGGGLKMGQVVGSTDAKAEEPKTRPCSVGDVLSTMYHVLGIDPRHEFFDSAKRPLAILSEGKPISELVG